MAIDLTRELFDELTWFRRVVGKHEMSYQVRRDTAGRLIVSELRIRYRAKNVDEVYGALPTGSGITRDVLRAIPLGIELRYAQAVLAAKSWDPPKPEPRGKRPSSRGRGRPPLSIATYRRVGARWNELVKQRNPYPAKTLAEEENINRSTMRAILRRYDDLAARRGDLPPRATLMLK